MQNKCKMNFIKDSFQRFCQYFKSTSHLLLLKVDILHHTEMYLSAYVCKACFKELYILLKYREIFEKVLKNNSSTGSFCYTLRTSIFYSTSQQQLLEM